jgi:hypothetical protein
MGKLAVFTMKSNRNQAAPHAAFCHDWLELVRRQVATLQFGVVQITVHESSVVQVERTERVRIGPGSARTNLTADQSTGGNTTRPGSLT